MPQPLDIKSTTGSTAGTTVASVDSSGNETVGGVLTVTGGVINLVKAAAAPGQQPGTLALYTTDGITLSQVAAGGQPAKFSTTQLNLTGATASSTVLTAAVSGDTVSRYAINADGGMNWGPGNGATDTNLYRAATAILQTDSSLQAGGTQIAAAKNVLVGSTTALGDNGVGELQLATVTTEATTNPTGGVLVYANSAGHLKWRDVNGVNPVVGGSLATVTSTTTIANSAALTALQAFTVPANDPITGSCYRMTGFGVFSVTGTPTLTFALYWGGTGGTSIAAVPAVTAAAGITSAPFRYEALVCFRSTTSCTAVLMLDIDTSAATDATSRFVATPTAASTVTTNVNSDLTIGFTWSAASASNTISLLGGSTELVR